MLQYIVTYGGEPVFVSDDKQQSMVVGKMIAAFYFGFDFEIVAHDLVTVIKSNEESQYDVVIFGLSMGDMFYINRLIEQSKPAPKDKVTTTRSILPRRNGNAR
jgi:hypothetical protein